MEQIHLGIVGSRHFEDKAKFEEEVGKWIVLHGQPHKIVSGGCVGADKMAIDYAKDNKIAWEEFPPQKQRYGSQAYRMRNQQIVDASTHLLAFVASDSRGTWMTIGMARRKGIHVTIVNV